MDSSTLENKIIKPQKRNDGFAVKCLRGVHDIMQIHLAKEVGVSKHIMDELEKTEEIKEPHLSQIANALSVDVETITNFNTDSQIQINNNTFNQSQFNVIPSGPVINNGISIKEYKEIINKYIDLEKEISTLQEQLKNKS